MGESSVLFVNGPLAGEWRVLWNEMDAYECHEPKPPTILDYVNNADLYAADAPYRTHLYRITRVTVFDYQLRVAHVGDEQSRTAGCFRYLVAADVRDKLEAR